MYFEILGNTKMIAQVDQVKDIFLEARATKPDRGLEEFRTDTAISTDRMCDFVDIGTSRFAKR